MGFASITEWMSQPNNEKKENKSITLRANAPPKPTAISRMPNVLVNSARHQRMFGLFALRHQMREVVSRSHKRRPSQRLSLAKQNK
jgi:hypothetical protein